MGPKVNQTLKKKLNKASPQSLITSHKKESTDFLPLEGGPGHKVPEQKPAEGYAKVVYIGRIAHGFYEKEMEGFFSQFGAIKRLRIARNKKVAKIVADTMHNYLLYEHLLQVHLVPPERVHPNMWKGRNYRYKPLDWVQLETKRQNKERTLEGHKKMIDKILKRDAKRRKRIEAAGIDYECPEIVGSVQSAPKKIKFNV